LHAMQVMCKSYARVSRIKGKIKVHTVGVCTSFGESMSGIAFFEEVNPRMGLA